MFWSHPLTDDKLLQVVCPFPSGDAWQTTWSCYRNEVAGSGPAFVIRSDCIWDGFQTKGRVVQAGVDKYVPLLHPSLS